jgi:hypothetical protein
MNIILWIVSFIFIVTKDAILVTAQEVSLGFFTTLAHRLQGEVVLLSDRVMEVRGFVYDGTAPAVYFWADTNPVPSTNGFRLFDGSPTNGCGVNPIPAAADGTQTYRVEFPDNMSINDILGGSISVWCEEFVTSFGEVCQTLTCKFALFTLDPNHTVIRNRYSRSHFNFLFINR